MDILFRIRGGLDLAFQLATTDGVSIRLIDFLILILTFIKKLFIIFIFLAFYQVLSASSQTCKNYSLSL